MNHPIIALWSHPRSMSTAMERIMRERGDLDCLHEPFMYYYYIERQVRAMPHFDVDANQPVSYQDIAQSLYDRAISSPVFFKDMSYYVIPEMLNDEVLLSRLTHSFLIRNPLKSILSYHKLDNEVTLDEIGLEAQWHQYQKIQQVTKIHPIVIEAESVQASPKTTISDYWQRLGLDYQPKAFDWQDKPVPDDWAQVEGWHGSVSASQGIRSQVKENDDELSKQFQQYVDKTKSHQLNHFLEHHWPYYEKLRDQA